MTTMLGRLRIAFDSPPARLLLIMLLLIDAALIAAHLSQKLVGTPGGPHADLGVDRSWGEFMLMVKWSWLAVLGLIAWRRRRAPIFASLALIALLLLTEDLFLVHERIGWALAEAVAAALPAIAGSPLVVVQVGELAWFGVLVVVLLVIAVAGWRRSDASARHDGVVLSAFLITFAFFAVVVDSVHSFAQPGSLADSLLTALEDGGELASVSPAVAYAFRSTGLTEGARQRLADRAA